MVRQPRCESAHHITLALDQSFGIGTLSFSMSYPSPPKRRLLCDSTWTVSFNSSKSRQWAVACPVQESIRFEELYPRWFDYSFGTTVWFHSDAARPSIFEWNTTHHYSLWLCDQGRHFSWWKIRRLNWKTANEMNRICISEPIHQFVSMKTAIRCWCCWPLTNI